MAKVKKMADGGLTGLGGMLRGMGGSNALTMRPVGFNVGVQSPPIGGVGGGGGSGGSAQDGINQINSGAQTVSGAIGFAQNALGGGGGAIAEPQSTFKKGGSVGKTATKVTTASKNKTTPNW